MKKLYTDFELFYLKISLPSNFTFINNIFKGFYLIFLFDRQRCTVSLQSLAYSPNGHHHYCNFFK